MKQFQPFTLANVNLRTLNRMTMKTSVVSWMDAWTPIGCNYTLSGRFRPGMLQMKKKMRGTNEKRKTRKLITRWNAIAGNGNFDGVRWNRLTLFDSQMALTPVRFSENGEESVPKDDDFRKHGRPMPALPFPQNTITSVIGKIGWFVSVPNFSLKLWGWTTISWSTRRGRSRIFCV